MTALDHPDPTPVIRAEFPCPDAPRTIRVEPDSDDTGPCCACGNTPNLHGFHPVDQTGRRVDPAVTPWPRRLYECNRPGCGLVFDLATLDTAAGTYDVAGRIVRAEPPTLES